MKLFGQAPRSLELPESFRRQRFRLAAEIQPMEVDGTLTMPVRLADLARFVGDTKEFLFHSNIRNYLRRTAINRGIEKTLDAKPEKFWLYNNGITIVCDDYVLEGKVITLNTPQVVNGCQTANTIAAFMKGKTQKEREEFNGRVLVRIIRDASPGERAEITKYTNSQNAVKGKDFLSLDQFQRKLQTRLRDLGYYYEIQRGSFAIQSRVDKMRYQGATEYAHLTPQKPVVCIPSADAVQGYVSAFLQKPNIAYGRPSELMPLGERYKEVFNDDTPDEPEYFLLPVLIGAFAAQSFEYGHGGDTYRRYGRWFFVSAVFATVLKLLKMLKAVDENSEASAITAEHMAAIFQDKDLILVLLRLVEDVILDRYFDDTSIRRIVKDDYRNYFKSGCATPQARDILDQKIEDALGRKEGKQVQTMAARMLTGSSD